MKQLIIIAFGIFIAIPAKAFDYLGWGGAPMYTDGYFLNSAYSTSVILTSPFLNGRYKQFSDDQGKVVQTPANKTTKQTLAPSATKPKWPKKLAKKFPKEQRKEWKRVFNLSLRTYYKIEKNLKIPKNDIAGAIAAYITGNYMAYHNTRVPDSDFVNLVNQMRSLLVNIPEFKRAKKTAKRDLYELMAIGGTFMAIAMVDLQQQPNQSISDNLQLVAKDNLEQFFGTSIFNIEIVNGELVIRQ